MLTPSQQSFLTLAAQASVESQRICGVPAELTLPQAIIESGWGKSTPGCNCFGIKAHAGQATQLLNTTEFFTPTEASAFLALGNGRTAVLVPGHTTNGRDLYDCKDLFAAYSTLKACFDDHGVLIAHGAPYAEAWKLYNPLSKDFSAFILAVCLRYATAPTYGQNVLALSQSFTVADALQKARATA